MKLFFILALMVLPLGSAHGISRADVMDHAVEYSDYLWTSSVENMTASCSAPYTSLYLEIYGVGGPHKGLAYDWGGWDTVEMFAEKISSGFGAGTHASDGVLSCTTGQDCSGFISRCWETSKKYATSFLADTTTPLASTDDLLPGDAINKPSSHVVLFDSFALNGKPLFYESAGGQVRKVWFNGSSSWSYLEGYTPVRYNQITDDDVVMEGHAESPILIDSFPATDSRSTLGYGASQFDAYSCAPEKGELGPEVVYQLEFPTAGKFTASVACGPGVDIDLHLLTELSASSCIDRAHEVLGPINVEAGTYFLVADSWSNASGVSYPGAYDLEMTFLSTGEPETEEPSSSCSGSCGDWAPSGCGCGPDCMEAGDCCADACELCQACAENAVEEPQNEDETREQESEQETDRTESETGETRERETDNGNWQVSDESEQPSENATPNTDLPPTPVGIAGWAPPPQTQEVHDESSGCQHRGQRSGNSFLLLLCIGLTLSKRMRGTERGLI